MPADFSACAWSHFHFLPHFCLVVAEHTHFGCQCQGATPELKADALSAHSVQVVLISPPLHSVTAKCSRQKSSRTGSQSCSWGQTGHRSLYWHVGHISQMTGAQAERPKWLWSEVGGLPRRPLTADSLQQGRHGLGLVSFRIIILTLFFFIVTSPMRKMKVSEKLRKLSNSL